MNELAVYSLSLVKEKIITYPDDCPIGQLVKNPSDIAETLTNYISFSTFPEEHFYVIALDTKHKIIGLFPTSHGTIDHSLCSPREIFKRAFLLNSPAIILAHNHPSGNPEPSVNDINVTKKIKEAGVILNIDVLDHLIFGDDKWVSLKKQGKM